ncbi:MAG: methylmalonyl-CoA mutase [Elusimicrobia bacterium RIFCSPHIGHO2_02_FULL_57_9]|nr:MAG: methylmalonyl-CoA mutase [Elusimicrobia bacterium RIFCSPHIGHO2_02_FULL_57_9]
MSEETAFKTVSGIEIGRYYGPENAPGPENLGHAGEYPFTRGIQKTMYRGRLWTMRQYAGFGTARQTNERFRWLLSQGQTGLSTAFDLPAQMGLDADDARAKGEVGRVGVHIGTIEDMERLFENIPLDKVSTSLTINATAVVLLAFYVAVAKRRAVGPEALRGTLQNDILKEFIARGTYIYPVAPSLRLVADSMEYAFRHMPNFHPISISGYHIREAGSDAVQEIAFTFANAEVYIKELLRRGLTVDQCGGRLAFFFGCHNHFLEEIAKFRAARRVWAKMMKEDYGARDPKTISLRFHVQTCGSTLTSQQPRNNVVRVSLQAMAAVLGGCQSLHTNAYDEALALPSRQSAELALRTQQILAHETGIPDTVDPTAGSWAIESLTAQLESKIWETIKRVRDGGGMLGLIEKGVPQGEIQEKAYQYQQDVESGRRKIVGLNYLALESENGKRKETLKVSPKVESEQIKGLIAFKRNRASGPASVAAEKALQQLASAAASTENLFPHILNCVESRATLGEICGRLRAQFGEFHGG